MDVRPAKADEIEELLPLIRGYCDFYEADPPDDGLREMARVLIAEPDEGAMFIARDEAGKAVGFAAMGWKWSSLSAARAGVLEDLFVAPEARGKGLAEALIEACAERCRERGATKLEWVTATDNRRAQAVYDRIGGEGATWMNYELEL
jgi:GNAT superfamily N-acetyltransferase